MTYAEEIDLVNETIVADRSFRRKRKRQNIELMLLIGALIGCLLLPFYLALGRDSSTRAAQPDTPIRQVAVEGWMRAVGTYQELTLDTTTAQELTVPEGAHLVWLQAAGNTIRYRLDDTNPTTTVGFELYAGDYVLPPGLLYHMRFISSSGTATLRAQPIGM